MADQAHLAADTQRRAATQEAAVRAVAVAGAVIPEAVAGREADTAEQRSIRFQAVATHLMRRSDEEL